MTATQIRTLVSRYIGERLDEWEAALSSGEKCVSDSLKKSRDWQDCLARFSESSADDGAKTLSMNELSIVSADIAASFIAKHKLHEQAKEGSSLHRYLCRELLKAEMVIANRIKECVNGVHVNACNSHGESGESESIVPDAPRSECDALSIVIPAYLKHFAHRPRTVEAKRHVLKRFLQIIGDKPIHAYLQTDCLLYRDTLGQLPTNTSKRFPGLPLAEVVEWSKGLPKKDMLSKQTVNQDLRHLNHFFGHLIKEGLYPGTNPVDGLAYEGIEAKSHETFSETDIQAVFGSEEFKVQLKEDAARYWLPMILLYSGACREEIANVALSDIREEEGIQYFDIPPGVKDQARRRRVPIHSQLIKLGLLDYVEGLRARGETLLFHPGDWISKWFHRLLKNLGVKGKKSLQGLRPTVTMKLYEAGVDGETRRALFGHSGNVDETDYLRLSLKTLSENLEKLKYPIGQTHGH
jgi:integrase